jgi:hypothetical protein
MDNAGAAWPASASSILLSILSHHQTVEILNLGLASALGLTRIIVRLLYGIGANDPVTMASVITLLGAMSLLACYFPAHRAMRRNPVTAIREL